MSRRGILNIHPINPEFQLDAQKAIDLIEREKREPFYYYYKKYSPEYILNQFKNTNSDRLNGNFIPKHQYWNLLKRYMNDPITARIPDNIVHDGLILVIVNTCKIISVAKLYGRLIEFPLDVVNKIYQEANVNTKEEAIEFLYNLGFHEGVGFEGRRPMGTDLGISKLYRILKEYDVNLSPEDQLIMINKCINVTHFIGNLSRYFIDGGDLTCNEISK